MKISKLEFILSIIIVFLICLICYFAVGIPSVKRTIVMATTHQSETFTELYFTDHNNLPKTVSKNGYGFDFTVHNLENKDFNYSYIVYFQNNYQKKIIDQGSFVLKNDEVKTVKENFSSVQNMRTEVIVELTNKNQQIDFWMEPSI